MRSTELRAFQSKRDHCTQKVSLIWQIVVERLQEAPSFKHTTVLAPHLNAAQFNLVVLQVWELVETGSLIPPEI